MRTAKEWRREIGDQCGSRAGIYTDEEIAAIQNEAIAHGMTLAAEMQHEIAKGESEYYGRHSIAEGFGHLKHGESAKAAILIARDNKIWRKE